ncbi:MAG: stage III sporulation protein AE [Clostridiales bacterium]|nr:stage III sporulation protein AE [Clostridiales bacterium]
MFRIKKTCMCAAVLIVIMCAGSFAAATDVRDIVSLQEEALGINEIAEVLPEEVQETLSGLKKNDLDGSFLKILTGALKKLVPVFRRGLKSVAIIICIVILEGMCTSLLSGGVKTAALAGSLAIAAVSVSDAKALIGLGSGIISDLDIFSKALLPAVAAASASTGAVATSAAVCAVSMLFSDILMTLISRFLLPLVYAYIAAGIAAAAVGGRGMDTLASLIKSFIKLCLTVILASFVLYLNLTKVFSGAADAAVVKATKLTISGLIPVIGSIIADAAETVASGAAMVRSALGITGVLGILAVCVVPFMRVGAQYVLYKIVSVLSDTVSGGTLSGLVGRISSAFGMILGMLGACAFLLLVSIVSAVRITVA